MLVLDTSSIIDGRIFKLLKLNLFPGPFIISQAVIDELNRLARSKDSFDARKGKRGLKLLADFRQSGGEVELVNSSAAAFRQVDTHLLDLAKNKQARLVTLDQALAGRAIKAGVKILNINQLSFCLRPEVIPGQQLVLKITENGSKQGQGLGYLDDGTVVVVAGGADYLDQEVEVKVSRFVQKEGGVVVFAKVK